LAACPLFVQFAETIIIRMYICICNAITERQVRACVDAGAASLDDLQFELGVASCCGRCASTACEYLPGGRASSVCEVRDVTRPVKPAEILAEQGQAANSSPAPAPAAAAA
jgi:bacterioferritin-associated ferredoxin